MKFVEDALLHDTITCTPTHRWEKESDQYKVSTTYFRTLYTAQLDYTFRMPEINRVPMVCRLTSTTSGQTQTIDVYEFFDEEEMCTLWGAWLLPAEVDLFEEDKAFKDSLRELMHKLTDDVCARASSPRMAPTRSTFESALPSSSSGDMLPFDSFQSDISTAHRPEAVRSTLPRGSEPMACLVMV